MQASPSTGATTGSRTRRSTGSTVRPRPPGSRLPYDRRWREVDGRLRELAGYAGQLDHPRSVIREYALCGYGRRCVCDVRRRWQTGRSSARASRSWPSTDRPRRVPSVDGSRNARARCVQDLRHSRGPALVLSKVDGGQPVGPSSNVTYTLTLKNEGNAPATATTITDPLPANTSFVSADHGGISTGGVVTWYGLTVAAGDSVTVHLTGQHRGRAEEEGHLDRQRRRRRQDERRLLDDRVAVRDGTCGSVRADAHAGDADGRR